MLLYILQNEKFYKEWEITAKLGFIHVDSESVVKCGEYMVSVVKRDEIIAEFTNIEVIMVYSEITDHKTYLDLRRRTRTARTFAGKGKYPSNYTSMSFIIHPSSFIHSFIYP